MSEKSFGIRVATRFRGSSVLSGLQSLTGRTLKDHSWIFIVGCYNSGTTLLEKLLSAHPSISGLNEEGVMLTNLLKRPEDFGWRRMWCMCEDKMHVPHESEPSASIQIKKHWSHFYDRSKPFLLEKSISNTTRILFFEKYFQPAYFIHIVRNGYPVAEGIHRKATVMKGNLYDQNKNYPINMCARQWKRSIEVVEANKSKVKNFLEIRYEDLTENPDEVLGQICDFLRIEKFANSFINTPISVHGKDQLIRNMNEASISKLTAEQLDEINQEAGDFIEKYGYKRT